MAYQNFVREPLRTYARDEVQRRNGLDVKEALVPIGDAVLARIRAYAADSPFVVTSVVVGNVQYPEEVSTAVSRKLAATQELQRKDTEIDIEQKERTKREVQAQGIANAMQIIRGQLSAMYIQHEAIEAQKTDGQLAEPHGGLHPGRPDGRADHRDPACDPGRLPQVGAPGGWRRLRPPPSTSTFDAHAIRGVRPRNSLLPSRFARFIVWHACSDHTTGWGLAGPCRCERPPEPRFSRRERS